MQTMEALVNPLSLPVTWEQPGDLLPRHGVGRPADAEAIAASMTECGWQGAPLVIDDRSLAEGGYLITGHHRHAAAIAARLTAVPCVLVTDLYDAAAPGTDLDAYDDTEWEAAFSELPAGIRDTYGIDC